MENPLEQALIRLPRGQAKDASDAALCSAAEWLSGYQSCGDSREWVLEEIRREIIRRGGSVSRPTVHRGIVSRVTVTDSRAMFQVELQEQI